MHLFHHLFHVIFCITLSLNRDLNVRECLIADLKKDKRALCPGKGGAGERSERATLYLLHPQSVLLENSSVR